MKVGKDAGVAKILISDDASQMASGDTSKKSRHAGMGALVTPRHVVTCAHVVNVALGQAKTNTRRPRRPVNVVFPLSSSPSATISARVIKWYEVGHATTSDVALLELDADAPNGAGVAVFGLVQLPLDADELSVFGTLGGQTGHTYVSTNFVGPTTGSQAQLTRRVRNIDRDITPKFEAHADLIKGGFSGAAVWDVFHDAAIGMVTAYNSAVEDIAYMIPAARLRDAWPNLPTETRRLPRSFDAIWSALAIILFAIMFYLFLANRRTLEGQPDILSPFWGLHVYAFLGTVVSCLWFMHAKDFKLHDWASRVPRFLAMPIERGSFAAKVSAVLTLLFLVLVPLVIEAHFIDVLNNRGTVYIYPDQFGFKADELKGCIPRDTPLCPHPDAGIYSTVKPRPPATGGFWDNAYHYGGDKNGTTVTFFPILQPVILQGLALVATLIQIAALLRTFWNGDWPRFRKKLPRKLTSADSGVSLTMQQPIRGTSSKHVPIIMQSPPRSKAHKDGEPDGGGKSASYCNPFLLLQAQQPNGPSMPTRPQLRKRELPDVLYGVLDQAEISDDGSVVLMFGTVAGDWLQTQLTLGVTVQLDLQFYVSMPLYLLEVRYDPADVIAIAGSATSPTSIERALLDLEGIWVRIALAAGGRPASLFDNLFGPAIPVGVGLIEPAESAAGQFLNSLDPLDPVTGVRDATEQEIENALLPSSSFDEIGIYDVGQGSANGLVSNREVVCYFDFGGGAAPNAFTFPPALASFCQCKNPPIILSHWDHDHWSSEGRDTRVHAQTWIVPRQVSNSTKRAPHHSSLIKAIQAAGGSILVWPSGLSTKRIGQLEISLCTGSSKNTSGLSLEVHAPSRVTALPVLMPADAGYDDLRVVPASGQHDAIVCPHHGGHSNSPNIPKPPSGSYQRLIYSYGPTNTYKHPLFRTYDPHHLADWFDNRTGVTKPTPPPHIVRNTEDRTSKGLGHVGFDWTTSTSGSALACGADLNIQQK
jgi:hypothetical protein